MEEGRWRRALRRPADRPAGDLDRRAAVPVAVEVGPAGRAGAGGVSAGDGHSGLIGIAEQGARGGQIVDAVGRPGKDAAGLAFAAAQRGRLEGAADEFALRDEDVEAGDDREKHSSGLRATLDFLGEQLLEHQRALAVADEDERAAGIAGGEILTPGARDVGVGEARRTADVGADVRDGDRADGHLAVDRGEGPAHRAEAGELVLSGVEFLAVGGSEVAVEAGIVADRGVDEEAVDRRVGGRRGGGAGGVAGGRKVGGGEGDGANVLAAGKAEPVGVLAVVDRGLGVCRLGGGGGGQDRESGGGKRQDAHDYSTSNRPV